MSTRMAVMNEGCISQIGTPTEIYESPGNSFVAGFIGAANKFQGRVLGQDGDVLLVHADTTGQDLRVCNPQAVASGTPVVVAVRPEKMRITQDEHSTADNRLNGTVAEIAYLGDVSIYHVRIASGALIEAQLTNRTRRADATLTWGDPVWLVWDSDDAVALFE